MARFLGIGWVVLAALVAGCRGKPALRSLPPPPDRQPETLLLVDQSVPWLVAAAAPVAAQLRDGDRIPPLLPASLPPMRPTAALLERIRPEQTWWLTDDEEETPQEYGALAPQAVVLGSDPAAGSAALARRFWPQSETAVIAAADDSGGIIRGAALAAQLRAPLLLYDAADDRPTREALAALQVRRALAVAAPAAAAEGWLAGTGAAVEVLDAAAAEARLVERLSPAAVRMAVLARAPAGCRAPQARTAWYAPYVSLVRGAPLALCAEGDAAAAEAAVAALVARAPELRPRTLLILADYEAIETRRTVIGAALPGAAGFPPGRHEPPYVVEVEPCVPVNFAACVPLGVGRIPFAMLEDAGAMFVGGMLRPQWLDAAGQRVLLVANARHDRYPLPLCETVSRVAAEELKNCGLAVDEFYRTPSDDLEVLAATRAANLIVYEGHFGHQRIFPVPHAEDDEIVEERPARREPDEDVASPDVEPPDDQPPPPDAPLPDDETIPQIDGPLEGMPVVVLQSCDSLRPQVVEQVLELGGVALVGGATPIHSASGSAFAKAMLDSVLYRGSTLGEALCDAQNFLFCVQDLKRRRGHNELAKVQRVALGFRLWGDPELSVFAGGAGPPELPPLAARWSRGGQLSFVLPEQRLPPAGNEDYAATVFPGSELAGIVQRSEGSRVRRVSPMYFVRLELPPGRSGVGLTAAADSDESQRLAVRVDGPRRLLYALYFPETDAAGRGQPVPLEAR